jgi:mono/diheme cytochrome c family protein
VASLTVSAGCRQDMHDQPKYEPYEKSDFFTDGRAMRPQVEGTVARGQLREDARLYTGKEGAAFVAAIPLPVDEALVRRGQERFGIYCTPCHGLRGLGNGMVVQRGYRTPASFHDARLKAQPDGYFFDVITHGFGAMPDYAAQVPVRDRWAIVAYIRALQLSQSATLADVPEAERARLASGTAPAAAAPAPEGALHPRAAPSRSRPRSTGSSGGPWWPAWPAPPCSCWAPSCSRTSSSARTCSATSSGWGS